MGRSNLGRGGGPGRRSHHKAKEQPRELPTSIEELRKVTGPMAIWAMPIVRAYDTLLESLSDEALDAEELEQGKQAVAALLWYYGLTHPLVIGGLFVAGTTLRRAPKIARKVRQRRTAAQAGIPTARPAAAAPLRPVPEVVEAAPS